MRYREYQLPLTGDVAQDEIDLQVRLYNHGRECWCTSSSQDVCNNNCDSCLLCSNYGNAAIKENIYALWLRENGYACTRTGIRHDVIEKYAGRHDIKFCAYCGSPHETEDCICAECESMIAIGALRRCVECGAVGDSSTIVIPYGHSNSYCRRCATSRFARCSDCGRWLPRVFFNESMHVCDACMRDRISCGICGRRVSASHICTLAEGIVCCDDCHDNENHAIHRYSFRPSPSFHHTETDTFKPIYLGVELEAGDACMDTCSMLARNLADESSLRYYLKSDSSIPAYGFEIVTMPCTLNYHLSEFGWGHILAKLRCNGFKSHTASRACGLHVHVNKDALSANRWILVDWFISKYRDKWTMIARRSESHYAPIKRRDINVPLKYQYGTSYERYTAVNFCNQNTVEFRLFRGSLITGTVLGTLSIVDGLINWARDIDMKGILHKQLWDSFVIYLKMHNYTHAIAYLESRNIIQSQNN